jgi:hypothetical protein
MMVGSGRSRSRGRSLSPVELAATFAVVGSVLAVAIPTFVREVHASRLAEPVDGLKRIGEAAVAYADDHPLSSASASAPAPASASAPVAPTPGFPPSAPMTPPLPPRGHCEPDPPGAWQDPGWVALDFRPAPPGTPHCFAFAFDSTLAPPHASFRAHAHGDLDGDGITSTFQITGQSTDGDSRGALVDPGMLIDSEVE